jgi:hypothetical protein
LTGHDRAAIVHFSIATGYRLENAGVELESQWVENVVFTTSSKQAPVSIQPHMQYVSGAFSPGIKRPERETDHSLVTSSKVEKMWIYTSTP